MKILILPADLCVYCGCMYGLHEHEQSGDPAPPRYHLYQRHMHGDGPCHFRPDVHELLEHGLQHRQFAV